MKINNFFELAFAFTFFKGKSNRSFLTIITIIAIAGVCVGVTTLITVLSVMTGFDTYLRNKIINHTSHIIISSPYSKYFDVSDTFIHEIKLAVPEIAGVSPVLSESVLIKSSGITTGVLLKGINPEKDKNVTQLYNSIIEGKQNYVPENNGIFLGVYLANKLGVTAGDEITVITPNITFSLFDVIPGMRKLNVSGIFKTGMFEYDSAMAAVTLKTAQSLFSKPDKVTKIECKLNNIDKTTFVADKLSRLLKFNYLVSTWIDLNYNLFTALKLEKFAMFIILVLIILVASLNIASTLIVSVIEKVKEIGVLRTIGASRKSISVIFLLKGFIIGIIGTGLGVICGLGLTYAIGKYEIKMPGNVYYIDKLPIKIDWIEITVICVVSVLICIISSLYPAFKASKLNPIDAIRN